MSRTPSDVLCVLAAASAAAYAAVQPSNGLVLRHANIVDGVTSDVGRDMTVVISGGRIESVSAAAPVDAVVIERDPLADLRALENPVLVVNDGRIAVDRIVQ